mgnify:FL=1
MATLKNTIIDDTASMKIPVGTTGQRPTNPVNGDCRYNTDLGYVEFYYRGFWVDARTNTGGITGPNLELVLDVGSSASFTSGSTNWLDISGNDRHFVWSSARTIGYDTTHEHNTPGIPYVETNGVRAEGPASNSFNIDNNSGYTVFMVFRQNSPNSSAAFRWEGGTGATSSLGRGIFAHCSWSNNQIYFDQGGCCDADERVDTNSSPYGEPIMTRWNVIAFRCLKNRQARSIWKNGINLVETGTTAKNIDLNGTAAQVGNSREYANAWDAKLAFFAIYSAGLDDDDMIRNTVALRNKFGI